MVSDNAEKIADDVSNSYQRIIRYLEPQSSAVEESDAAFWPHVDSTFLTVIPMPEIAGLEVWCPSLRNSESKNLAHRGEWVRPIKPSAHEEATTRSDPSEEAADCIHVVALAGEFLQLLSDGQVPTCIHRVIAPQPPPLGPFGFSPQKYKARVSAPLFLRPRRGEDAILDVKSDLKGSGNRGLYFEKGLLQECDSMHVWDYMHCMSPDN
jgi:isopenicillin N synthase-like dioxygenase